MKKIAMLTLAAMCAICVQPALAQDNGDPSEVRLKIEAMWVSTSPECTDATLVFEEMPAVYRDMTQNPTFGAANVVNGDYACLMFRMSDRIEATSAYDSTSGNCTNGQALVVDIFRSGSSSTCPDGTTVTGTSGEDSPCVYFSTGGTSQSDGYEPQLAMPLGTLYRVTNDKNATIVTDFRGQVVDTGSTCDVFPPVFSFRE